MQSFARRPLPLGAQADERAGPTTNNDDSHDLEVLIICGNYVVLKHMCLYLSSQSPWADFRIPCVDEKLTHQTTSRWSKFHTKSISMISQTSACEASYAKPVFITSRVTQTPCSLLLYKQSNQINLIGLIYLRSQAVLRS